MKTKIRKIWAVLYPPILYLLIRSFFVMVFSTIYAIPLAFRYQADRAAQSRSFGEYAEDILAGSFPTAFVLSLAAIATVLLYYGSRRLLGQAEEEEDREERKQAKPLCLCLGITALVVFGVFLNLLVQTEALRSLVYQDAAYMRFAESLGGRQDIWLPFMLVIAAPLAEEYVFREMSYKAGRKFLGVKAAVFINALYFGTFHGNVVQGVYAFLLGLGLAYLYERSGHIIYPVLAHTLVNFCALLVPVFLNFGTAADSRQLLRYLGIHFVLLVALGIFIGRCMYQNRKKKEDSDEATQYSGTLL